MRFLAALALAACGTPPNGQPDAGGLDGSVGGSTLEIKDGLFFKVNVSGVDRLVLAVSDRMGVCAREQAAKDKANSTLLILKVLTESGQIPPGLYGVRQPPEPGETLPSAWAEAIFQRYGPLNGTQCALVQEQSAQGGIVELFAAETGEGKKAKGNFDLVFSLEDRIAGSFEVPFCDTSQAPGETTCEP